MWSRDLFIALFSLIYVFILFICSRIAGRPRSQTPLPDPFDLIPTSFNTTVPQISNTSFTGALGFLIYFILLKFSSFPSVATTEYIKLVASSFEFIIFYFVRFSPSSAWNMQFLNLSTFRTGLPPNEINELWNKIVIPSLQIES